MNNDINEKIVHAAPVPPFVRFVASAVPMVFDNSLSYYEALCALWKWMQDNLVDVINHNATVTEQYIDYDLHTRELFIELKSYVDNYFDNLDVQEEINNKLDQMAEDGTLQEIITAYIQANVTWTFDTVADMKLAANLTNGSYARTLGFHGIGDGGGAIYKISNSGTANEMDVIAIGSLFANLVIFGDIKPELFGAYGDGTHNDSTAFNRCLNYTFGLQSNLNNEVIGRDIILTKDYLIDKLSIPQGMEVTRIIGKKARIRTGGFTFNASTGWKVLIQGIIFDNCTTPIDFDYRNLEYGRYEIINCVFNGCSGVCCNIERRSCQVIIDGCTFRGSEKSVYVRNVDMFIFKNNWVECTSAYPWGNNHYDIEQYAPDEGSMIIENNMFIPGYTQTGTNPCWIKVGRNAIIKNNRFSGENTSIHPIIIDYDNYASFSVNSSVYPIVDITDNPIMTGETRILLAHACGQINLTSNSGWAGGGRVMATSGADADTYFTNLDYKWLSIVIRDNGGRSFNFKDDYGIGLPAAYKPTVATVLQRFIKDKPLYQDNYNYELKSSVSNHVLTLDYYVNNLERAGLFVIGGKVNKNPGGTGYYEHFVALVGLERYYDGGLHYRVNAKIVSANNQNVSFTCQINGADHIDSLASGEHITITVTGSGTARAEFETAEMLRLKPISNAVCN